MVTSNEQKSPPSLDQFENANDICNFYHEQFPKLVISKEGKLTQRHLRWEKISGKQGVNPASLISS